MELVRIERKTYVVVLQIEFQVMERNVSWSLIWAMVSNEFKKELNEALDGQENRLLWRNLSFSKDVPSGLNAHRKAKTKKKRMKAA